MRHEQHHAQWLQAVRRVKDIREERDALRMDTDQGRAMGQFLDGKVEGAEEILGVLRDAA